MILWLAPLVGLVGLLVFAFAEKKMSTVGLVAYAAGLLVTLLEFAGTTYHLLGR